MTEPTPTPTEPVEPTPSVEPAEPTEPETFDRAYVERLRGENAEHRTRAARADVLESELVAALAGSTGLLADPGDLARYADRAELLDDAGNPDQAKVRAAAEALVVERPHLRSRRPTGDVGQGARVSGVQGGTEALSGMLQAAAT